MRPERMCSTYVLYVYARSILQCPEVSMHAIVPSCAGTRHVDPGMYVYIYLHMYARKVYVEYIDSYVNPKSLTHGRCVYMLCD